MSPVSYIIYSNFLSFFFVIFLLIFIIAGKKLPKATIKLLIYTVIATAILGVCDCINCYCEYIEYSFLHTFISALGYTIRPFCAAFYIFILVDNKKWINYLVATVLTINTAVGLLSIKFPLIFYYTLENEFVRGPLWIVPFVTSFSLFIILFIMVSMEFNVNRRKCVFSYAVIASVTLGVIGESTSITRFTTVSSGLISIFFLYLYLTTDIYKRDALTKLYDRRTFDKDISKFAKRKMVVATMDLNDLKQWNDKFGHPEGDKALIVSSQQMVKNFNDVGIIYRTGGDEFIALFPKKNISDLEQKVEQFQKDMLETPYRVAFGCAQFNKNDDLQEVLSRADKLMYENKKYIKENSI